MPNKKDKNIEKVKTVNRPKELDEILEQQVKTALKEYKRSNSRLFLAAITAGLEVGFSFFLMVVIYTMCVGQVSPHMLKFLLALSYPIGFIFVVIGRSELFTEHTSLAVLPVLNGVLKVKDLLQLWTIILVGNLIGGFMFSFAIVSFAGSFDTISVESIAEIGYHIINYKSTTILFSAIFAGWLMGLLTWLVASAQETISRIIVIILITFTIGIGGLHHSIVGSIEAFSAYLASDSITILDYLKFESFAILGNLIGGVFFVGLIKNSQKER